MSWQDEICETCRFGVGSLCRHSPPPSVSDWLRENRPNRIAQARALERAAEDSRPFLVSE